MTRHRSPSIARLGGVPLPTLGLLAALCAGEALAGGPVVTQFPREALAWQEATPCWEGYAFDQFHPGVAGGGGCLVAPPTAPLTLSLGSGTVTITVTNAGAPACAMSDAATTPAVADVLMVDNTSVIQLQFDPPITAFYGYYGSLASGFTALMSMYSNGELVDEIVSATSPNSVLAIGDGFVSPVPIDTILISTGDAGGTTLGAFTGLAAGEPSLGTRIIDGYAGPSGSTVQLDFGVTFAMPLDRVHNLTRDTVHPCIRDAIDFAQSGDTLLVTTGTYREAIDLEGKELTITGMDPDDPDTVATTRIDAIPFQTSAIRCANGEGPGTTIRGLTISGGVAIFGGGAFVGGGASPTFDRCTFVANRADLGGGAYTAAGTSPVFSDCTFVNNVAHTSGGGLYLLGIGGPVTGCAFTNNSAEYGAGIDAVNLDLSIDGCAFEQNLGQIRGAGVYLNGATAQVDDCVFTANSSKGQGGGLAAINGGGATVSSCSFSRNIGGGDGGAVYSDGTSMWISHCDFDQNYAARGSGAYLRGATRDGYLVENCRFLGNGAPKLGAGDTGSGCVYLQSSGAEATVGVVSQCFFTGSLGVALVADGGSASLTLRHLTVAQSSRASIGSHTAALVQATNCVFASDTADEIITSLEGQVLWHHCLVRGSGGGGGQDFNLDADPLFVDAVGPDGLVGTSDDDCRPGDGSPLIEAGSDAAADFPVDLAGTPRTIGSLDIGAYEFAPDCDESGTLDYLEIADGTLPDCDGNLLADPCESIIDCNNNGIKDECDIASGLLSDANDNGFPDECEVFGTIGGTVVWNAATQPLLVMSQSVLITGSLTIEAGVTLLAVDGATMTIGSGGQLHVDGSADEPVVFKPVYVDPMQGAWNGLRFLAGSSGTLSHADVGYTIGYGVRVESAAVAIEDSHVHHVRGADAAAAAMGAVAQPGGAAYGILVSGTSDSLIARCRVESIHGGKGGTGAPGSQGVDGVTGNPGTDAGEAGQSGTPATVPGGPGGAGAIGGNAVGVQCSSATALTVHDTWVRGVAGGAGGDGGPGGPGGWGGHGGQGVIANVIPNALFTLIFPSEPPLGLSLNGGDGGDGGPGSAGGDGGPGGLGGDGLGIHLANVGELHADQNLVTDPVAGAGGAGGQGGRGGYGGYGGQGGFAAGVLFSNGTPLSGSPGTGGNGGDGGASGSGGSGGASGQAKGIVLASAIATSVESAQITIARVASAAAGVGGLAGEQGLAGFPGLGGAATIPQLVDELCPDGYTLCDWITTLPVTAGVGAGGVDGGFGGDGPTGSIGPVVGIESQGGMTLMLRNAILDAADDGDGSSVGATATGGADLFASYCLVHGFDTPFDATATNLGPGEWTADPAFVDRDAGDFHLSSNSFAIDQGSDRNVPSGLLEDLDGGERIVDGNGDDIAHVDLGVYEYASALPPILGDLDGNGFVDASDLAILLGAWGTDDPTADLDGDGVVGGSDLAILLGAWGPG